MKKFFILALLLLAAGPALSLELEEKRYEKREARALLLSGATNLEDPNCVRNIIRSRLHEVDVAMGCHIESINVLEDHRDAKKLHVGPQYYCPELNMTTSTVYTCYKK